MCGDSYKIRTGKMSRYEWMIDRRGGEWEKWREGSCRDGDVGWDGKRAGGDLAAKVDTGREGKNHRYNNRLEEGWKMKGPKGSGALWERDERGK